MRISQIREIQSSASDLNQNIARYDRFRNLEMSGDDKFLSNQIRMSSSWVRSSGDKSPESRSSWAVIKSPFCWCESTSICVTTKRRYIPRPHFQPWNHPRVERAVQYGERKRPEFLSIDLMIDAQVAHAPRTAPPDSLHTINVLLTESAKIKATKPPATSPWCSPRYKSHRRIRRRPPSHRCPEWRCARGRNRWRAGVRDKSLRNRR